MTLLKKNVLTVKGSWNLLNESPVFSCPSCGTVQPLDPKTMTIDSGNTASLFSKCADCSFQGVMYLEDFDRGLIIPPPPPNPPTEENSEKSGEFLV